MTSMLKKSAFSFCITFIFILSAFSPRLCAQRVNSARQRPAKKITQQQLNVAHNPFAKRINQKLPPPKVDYLPNQLPGQSWAPGSRSTLVVITALLLLGLTIFLLPRLE